MFILWFYLILPVQVVSWLSLLGRTSGKLECPRMGLPARARNPADLTGKLQAGPRGASLWNAVAIGTWEAQKSPEWQLRMQRLQG